MLLTDCAQDSWLEKFAAEQTGLGCEGKRESPELHVQRPEKGGSHRRNGLEWAGPFSSTDAQLSLPGNTTSPASGDEATPR